jgi:hypothetical protein
MAKPVHSGIISPDLSWAAIKPIPIFLKFLSNYKRFPELDATLIPRLTRLSDY